MLIGLMPIPPGSIRLPHLNQRLAYRPAFFIQYPSTENDPLTQRLAFVLRGQVAIPCRYQRVPKNRPRSLGLRTGQQN